jgi:acyl dehydratase
MKRLDKDLFFSDIAEDTKLITASRTVSEADIMLFAGLGGNLSEVHTSAEYAKNTRYGERIAHGYLTLAIADGLYMRTGCFENSAVANLGIEGWTFNRPVKIGDTIHLEVRLKEKHWITMQNAGVVTWAVKVLNQREETVASGIWKRLIRDRNN